MDHFWRWVTNETGQDRSLYLSGPIAQETWWGDETTPALFKSELLSGEGDVTVWINSPGGDVFAASEIYTMLKEYPHNVTVKINGVAASAASVIAMAGAQTLMSPVSYMFIHNPETIAIGDSGEMLRVKEMLDEIKEGIINAYKSKSKLSRVQISQLMDADSCFNARKAVELGFADGILYEEPQTVDYTEPVIFYRTAVSNSLISRVQGSKHRVPFNSLIDRLHNIRL